MADKVKVWFDADAAGYEKSTSNYALMERVDTEGNKNNWSQSKYSEVMQGVNPGEITVSDVWTPPPYN